MLCWGGGHHGFLIHMKNESFVNNHWMIIPFQFAIRFNQVGPSNDQACSFWNFFIHFPLEINVTIVLWWWPSWMSDPHANYQLWNGPSMIIHVQFGFNYVLWWWQSWISDWQKKIMYFQRTFLGFFTPNPISNYWVVYE